MVIKVYVMLGGLICVLYGVCTLCTISILMVASAFHTDVFVNKAKSIDISQVFRGKAGVFVVF